MSTLRIGIDTGGTYTDAVLMRGERIVKAAKSPTTRDDLSIGIAKALHAVLPDQKQNIEFISLSTTLATNGLIEKQGGRVGLILIGFDESPLPRAGLAEALGGDPVAYIDGGHSAGGDAKKPLDLAALAAAVTSMQNKVDAIAVNSFFAVRNPEHELQAIQWIREHTALPVSAGHQLSSALDAPKRALTSVINARLIGLITSLLDSARRVLTSNDIAAPLMVVKGDGSLISAAEAENTPVETILSGPAASVVGAIYLSKNSHCVVADMGGTTLDIAFVKEGKPKISDQGAVVGGYFTRVRAVEIYTSGLGGDSWIQFDRQKHEFVFGPKRATPICTLAAEFPSIIKTMEAQLERGWPVTHDGYFVKRRPHRGDIKLMSGKQRSIWAELGLEPMSMSELFRDQTLDRPLLRLIDRDWVALAAFTPTDAACALGRTITGEREAAILSAKIAMRYSAANNGETFACLEDFCESIIAGVSRLSAHRLFEAACADQFGDRAPIPAAVQNMALAESAADHFEFNFKLKPKLVGIGAPAHSYLPKSARILNTQYEALEYAHVANAIGAVVGLVRAEKTALITPLPNQRFRLHCMTNVEDFDALEKAVEAANLLMTKLCKESAAQSGAKEVELTPSRKDIIVHEGQVGVFFESRLRMVATGRPSF